MNYLIADSGATKTEWRLTGNSVNKTVQTEGLNPYYHTTETIVEVVKKKLFPNIDPDQIDEVFFYGAGCDESNKGRRVEKAFQECFTDTPFQVYHDLLAAARACFMDEAGIACILGTGSNSCLYDGSEIIEHLPSLAFILGDEGSAAYFGKKLINSYYRRELPRDLMDALEQDYNIELDYIMEGLYDKPQQSRFIASYGAFFGKYKDHPFIDEMLHEGFEDFITSVVKKYSDAETYKVSFVGSVACAHRGVIKEVLQKHGLKPGEFIQNQMERLVAFHTS